MRKQINFLLIFLLVSTSWAVGPQEELIPADAKWVVHTDMEKLKASHLGTLIIDELNQKEGLEDKLSIFADVFGFNPLKDIEGVTLYGNDKNPENGVALIQAAFDTEKFLRLLRQNPEYDIYDYGDHQIHRWLDEKKNIIQFGTFANKNLGIISRSKEKVQSALDVVEGTRENLGSTQALGSLEEMPRGTFFTIAAENLTELTDGNPKAKVLKNAHGLAMFLGEVDKNIFMDIDITAADSETATQIQQVFLGIKAFLILNQEKNPKLADLAQAVKITVDGITTKLSLSYPSEDAFVVLQKMAEAKRKARQKKSHQCERP